MGTPRLDDFGVQGKRSPVPVSTTFLLVLSIASFVLKIFAKLYTVARIQYEDWFMDVALLFSLGTPICELYGLYTRVSKDLGPADWSCRRNVGSDAEAGSGDIQLEHWRAATRNLENDKMREGIVILVQMHVTVKKEESRDDETYRLKRDFVDLLRNPSARSSYKTSNVWREEEVQNLRADLRVVRKRVDSYSRVGKLANVD